MSKGTTLCVHWRASGSFCQKWQTLMSSHLLVKLLCTYVSNWDQTTHDLERPLHSLGWRGSNPCEHRSFWGSSPTSQSGSIQRRRKISWCDVSDNHYFNKCPNLTSRLAYLINGSVSRDDLIFPAGPSSFPSGYQKTTSSENNEPFSTAFIRSLFVKLDTCWTGWRKSAQNWSGEEVSEW